MRSLARWRAGIAVLIWVCMTLVVGSLSVQCERCPFISSRRHWLVPRMHPTKSYAYHSCPCLTSGPPTTHSTPRHNRTAFQKASQLNSSLSLAGYDVLACYLFEPPTDTTSTRLLAETLTPNPVHLHALRRPMNMTKT